MTKTTIKIRRADNGDIAEIVPILKTLHGEANFSETAPFDPKSAERFTEALIKHDKGELLVADLNQEEIIGICSFVVDSPYWNQEVNVGSGISFWVNPDYRHKKIGEKLYFTAETMAKELYNCTVVTVGVNHGQDKLAEYHKSHGFFLKETTYMKQV